MGIDFNFDYIRQLLSFNILEQDKYRKFQLAILDWNCVIVDDIIEKNEIIVGNLRQTVSWRVYFVYEYILLKQMYVMQEMKNEK